MHPIVRILFLILPALMLLLLAHSLFSAAEPKKKAVQSILCIVSGVFALLLFLSMLKSSGGPDHGAWGQLLVPAFYLVTVVSGAAALIRCRKQ